MRLKPQRNDKFKTHFRAYQAIADESRLENTAGVSQYSGKEQSLALTDETKPLVQKTDSSTISSTFSAIGLSVNVPRTHSYLNPCWIIDSGASNHMTGSHKDFTYQNYSGNEIVAANGEKLNRIAVHDRHLSTAMPFKLSNVFMVPIPTLIANMISGCKLTFSSNGCLIQDRQTSEGERKRS